MQGISPTRALLQNRQKPMQYLDVHHSAGEMGEREHNHRQKEITHRHHHLQEW